MANSICLIDDCDREARCRGLCRKHYRRWQKATPVRSDGRRKPVKECLIEGCERRASCRGWCRTHYLRWYRTGDPSSPSRRDPVPATGPICSIEGCNRAVRVRGWCNAHLHRFYRYGSATTRVRGEVIAGCIPCARCGLDVPVAEIRGAYCPPCEALSQVEYLAGHPRPDLTVRWEALCEVCGAAFSADNRRQYACSTECTRRRTNRDNSKHSQRRRAVIFGVEAESIRPRDIYDRDGWICQLCGDPLAPKVKAPHPDTPSIDHVIPLIHGGTHTRANVQAAHLLCNVRKGARLPTASIR